jgi:tRNA threonylcarbamoyl adenosine modification protein YeaZ
VLVLALDTATPAVTAGVVEVAPDRTGATATRAVRVTVDARKHGELLMPEALAACAEAGVALADIDAVVVGTGPGPFTGLRVGMVTAAALGDALDVPVHGVCSLDAIAAEAAEAGGPLFVVTDARRREVYWAVYEDGARLTEPAVDLPATVADRIADLGVTAAVGEGAYTYAEVLKVRVRDEPRYPPAEALAALAADRVRAKAPGERLIPLYLRRPDAVAQSVRKPVLP